MFSSNVTLDHFIQPVPICEPTTDLESILTILESKPDQVIAVVSNQGMVMGTINGACLFKYLPQLLKLQLSGNRLQLEQCLSECKNLLSPLITLPAQMSVSQLCLILPDDLPSACYFQSYAIVDRQGKFLGLLNSWSLLKCILSNSSTNLTRPQPSKSGHIEQILQEFLEQMPIPVVLFTQQGKILYQNCSWCQQLGDYHPDHPTNSYYNSSFPLEAPLFNGVDNQLPTPFCNQKKANFPSTKTVEPECIKNNLFMAVLNELRTPVQLLSRQGQQQNLHLLSNEELVGNSNPTASFDVSGTRWVPQSSWQALFSSPPFATSTLSKPETNQSWQFINVPLSFKKINQDDEPVWLVLAFDVTVQQQLCQELALKNTDLIQLNRLKDEFFTCISHELKSPLTSVIGLSSLLKEQKLGTLNERQVHYTELIYHSGRQLMMLVNDLLDLTRLETRQLKLKLLPINVTTVCQQAYNSIEERYKGKIDQPIPFTLDIDPGIEKIVADELRLQQMLFHLLDNALKLSNTDGKIGLKVSRWENWLAFTVWDTGIGIPEESQTLLFQQWQSQENRLSEQLEGTGLGLVLTQRLAKAHGGDISFISRKDRGSQFTLLLPNTQTQKNLENSISPTVSPIYPLVLVVESISATIEQMTDLLTRLGYRFVIARTGTEALEKARQLQPETIFLNPLLPLLSGWDVLKLLKSDAATKQIKVIVTSSIGDQPHSEKVGADGFLSLPVEQAALEKILAQSNLILSKFDGATNTQPTSPPQKNWRSSSISPPKLHHLTILRLHPDLEQADWMGAVIDSQFDLCLGKQLSQLNCRLLEADSLEQAEMIASVWDVHVVVLDGKSLQDPLNYLLCLSQCDNLAALPLVTLDTEITEAANKIENLSVFPCLLPHHENKIEQLLQVIQIAAGTR